MTARPLTPGSIISAAALTLVTLLVFFTLQDYGPESALRKFHEAIVQGDNVTLSRVTAGSLSDEVTSDAISAIRFLLGNGARYRLLRTDHRGKAVGAEAVYILPSGQTRTIYWIIVKQQGCWRVDALATQRVMSMPPSSPSATLGLNSPR